MLNLDMDGKRVCMKAAGTIRKQLDELLLGVHAWYTEVVERFPDAEEWIRLTILATIAGADFWRARPARKTTAFEVDSPEELFETGGD